MPQATEWTAYGDSNEVITLGTGWALGYAYTYYFGGPPPYDDPNVQVGTWTAELSEPV